jgi:hypothetical protein
MDDECRYDAAQAGEKAWASLLPVTVLDRNTRPLATGGLTPSTDTDQRHFLPHKPTTQDTLSKVAAFVRFADGRTVAVSDFRWCEPTLATAPHVSTVHYHLRIES